jgi:hypothetical protein
MAILKHRIIDISVKKLLQESGTDDPIEAIRDRARNLVSTAIDAGWKGPPFNPADLARLLGIDLMPNDDVMDARIIPAPQKKFTIEFNPNQRRPRMNFSICHEIGHFLFSDAKNRIHNREKNRDPSNWILEFLCDIAAAELLLPYEYIAKDAKQITAEIDSILDLANKYSSSVEATLLRFTEVSEKPCAVVLASFSDNITLRAEYVRNSSNFPISKDVATLLVPKNSCAYECTSPGWTAKGIEDWNELCDGSLNVQCIGLPPIRYGSEKRVAAIISPSEQRDLAVQSIEYLFGDITAPRINPPFIIAQVVNTKAAQGMGVGRAIGEKWPLARKTLTSWYRTGSHFKLGNCQTIELEEGIFLCQMLCQDGIKPKYPGQVLLKYGALRECLRMLCKESIGRNAHILMPRIGAGQAGGDWWIIEGMIHDELIRHHRIVTVYSLPGAKMPEHKIQLSLF